MKKNNHACERGKINLYRMIEMINISSLMNKQEASEINFELCIDIKIEHVT